VEWTDLLIRFLVGGSVVSGFALIGDLLKPKSFAGLFGAAPSIALSVLGLTIVSEGVAYARMEARSMVLGAVAFFLYAWLVHWIMKRYAVKALWATAGAIPLWFGAALGLWYVWLR
jgi:hypothetical protein